MPDHVVPSGPAQHRAGVVRVATLDDCDVIGRVHVAAWQGAYRGLMPDAYLDGLNPATRAERWRAALRAGGGQGRGEIDGHEFLLVVIEDEHGQVVGISAVGAAHGNDDPATGELWMINLAPQAWGKGLGRQLLQSATALLRRRGFTEAVLWVLEGNTRARRFYEIAGWRPDGVQRITDARGFRTRELRYQRRL